jgi:predicted protein tyrosine phosphatase
VLKEVIFVSQAEAEQTPGKDNWVVISVTQPSEPHASLKPGWRAILRLKFHDTDDEASILAVFSIEQARALVAFVEEHALGAVGVLVHCHAGVSRSAAIARFIGERYAVESFAKRYASYTRHNKLVYRRLRAVSQNAVAVD